MKRFAALLLSLLVSLSVAGCARPVDKEGLQAAVSEAGAFHPYDYTDESGEMVSSARQHGEYVLDDEDATQEQVDDATDAIATAMDSLVPYQEADKSELKAVISEASALEASDYEDESFKYMRIMLEGALSVDRTLRATPDEIADIAKALRDSIDALGPAPTLSQRNAYRMAKSYLDSMPFSHDGLVDQLEFEGFSAEDATYGADHCGADWNVQAFRMAQSYIDSMPFSRDGLIDQLEFEGFSYDQAVYGVDRVGL